MSCWQRTPEARYSYYRRCQLFRRNGEQCKAPAEKGAAICHAHAAQQAMAFRRDLERRIVLAEAVAEMRRQGKPECEMADLFTDFKGIQVTLAVVSRALIGGRIDCKTAGALAGASADDVKTVVDGSPQRTRRPQRKSGIAADLRRRAQIEQEPEAGIAGATNGVNTSCRAGYRWRRFARCVQGECEHVPGKPSRLQGRSVGAGESGMT